MKELSTEEVGLLNEMKDRCLNKGLYTDENAKKKFEMLCHLEDFSIQYYELQNNWNELKKIIEQDIRQCEELIEMCPKELRNTIIGTRSYEEIIGCNKHILSKMQELEQGKDE